MMKLDHEDEGGVVAICLLVIGVVIFALSAVGTDSRPKTTGECEADNGMVLVMKGSRDLPEAYCMRKGHYWPVRVEG